ncbi:cache domain-containing sensor histidine kinase [Paenibacillus koleovorans]|uniref:cache domain-containing sensor histidine kinase n=1 Tax=Paenibacillus koleovorans TaxID=121608 RepID=UPI000FDA5878|nr:sensor histidine kinase [Paenibacillus koleovorans]
MSYLFLTAIPFILSFLLISMYWWNSTKESSIQHSEKMLQTTKEVIQTHLRQMESLSISLYYDTSLLSLLKDREVMGNQQKRNQIIPLFEKLFLNMSHIRPDIYNYYYYDLNGKLIFVNINGVWIDYIPQTNYNPSEDEWFREAIRSDGKPSVVYQESLQEPVFSLSRLIKYLTDPIGVVLLNFNFNILDDVIGNSIFEPTSEFLIMGSKGDIFYQKTPSSFSKSDLDEVRQMIVQTSGDKPTPPSKTVTFNNSSYLMIYESLDRYQLKLIHLIPLAVLASENLNYIYKISVIMLLVIVILMAVSVYYFYRRIKPLKELADVMDASQHEPFDKRIIVKTRDEVGRLGISYNRMMSRLQQLIENEYKHRVQLIETEKKMLESQINPHFLYNTLDTIRFLAIEHNVKDIAKMLFTLSINLRYTISNTNKQVPVREEVQWLERYIYLQLLRFKDRFDVFFQIDVAIHDHKIYRLILQPFIENAIIHGFRNTESGGILNINGYLVSKDRITFEIVDNGCGFDEELNITITHLTIAMLNQENGGMYNALSRLFLYYGDQCEVNLQSIPNKRTAVRITISKMEEIS